jgi:hypothetical protein
MHPRQQSTYLLAVLYDMPPPTSPLDPRTHARFRLPTHLFVCLTFDCDIDCSAWFGYGFAGCDFPVAPEFLTATNGLGPLGLKLGEPAEDCREEVGTEGVFVRKWGSGKTTRLDCNSWTASLE